MRETTRISAYVTSSEEQPEILTEYECHHEETDTQFYFFLSRNNAKSSLLVSLDSDILHIAMANQLQLSNSVDTFFGKSSNSAFNYCSVNLLLEEIEHDEQLPVLQVISREQGSLGEVIAALYVITGNDQVSHFKSVGKKYFYKVF